MIKGTRKHIKETKTKCSSPQVIKLNLLFLSKMVLTTHTFFILIENP